MPRKKAIPLPEEVNAEVPIMPTEGTDELTRASVMTKKIGKNEIDKAMETLKEYQDKKVELDMRLIENEEWWRLHNFDVNNLNREDAVEPSSAWLFNCIISKHADVMDAYPEANILPRESQDEEEAKRLTEIIPVVLRENEFEDTYSDVNWYKLKSGTGCYGVFWDSTKHNGLGDIAIRKIDLLNLVWQPTVTNIQDSENLFYLSLVSNDRLISTYGDLVKNSLGSTAASVKSYNKNNDIDWDKTSLVIDWYYKKYDGDKTILHYCKFVNDVVLYATENETEPTMDDMGNVIGEPLSVKGYYDHGMYPFIMDVLFPTEGNIYGFGYVDVCKTPQKYIDLLNKALIKNASYGAIPRWLMRDGSDINEAELLDPNKPVVHVEGSLDDINCRPIEHQSIDGMYVQVLQDKIEELKETSGNRDVANGGSTSGVTAASAIAAMQEQSGKTSRDSTRNSYRTYEKIVTMVIELIRQFYNTAREFRIIGDGGDAEFITYSNEGLKQNFGVEMPNMGLRLPVFDIEVEAQKATPYTKLSQNEMVLDLYNRGFFAPDNADQALMAIEFMDFKGKDKMRQKIAENQTMLKMMAMMQQQMLQLAEIVDKDHGSNVAEQLGANIMGGVAAPMMGNGGTQPISQNGLGAVNQESKHMSNAREQAQNVAQPQ